MMAEGMKRSVYFHGDPTFDSVVAIFKEEAREARRKNQAMKSYRVFAAMLAMLRVSGYRLSGTVTIVDKKTGDVYVHGRNKI